MRGLFFFFFFFFSFVFFFLYHFFFKNSKSTGKNEMNSTLWNISKTALTNVFRLIQIWYVVCAVYWRRFDVQCNSTRVHFATAGASCVKVNPSCSWVSVQHLACAVGPPLGSTTAWPSQLYSIVSIVYWSIMRCGIRMNHESVRKRWEGTPQSTNSQATWSSASEALQSNNLTSFQKNSAKKR